MNYDEVTDWVAFLKHCIKYPDSHREMRPDDFIVEAGLERFARAHEHVA
jgi:hypothetical protein